MFHAAVRLVTKSLDERGQELSEKIVTASGHENFYLASGKGLCNMISN